MINEQQKTKILFFTPTAGRTGSEMMLWYILKNFDRSKFEAGLVSFAHGELLHELPADIPYWVAPRDFSLLQKFLFKLGYAPIDASIKKAQKQFKADIWYMNTMTLPEIVPLAKQLNIKLITHFHELSLSYESFKYHDLELIINHSDLLIGCSEITTRRIIESGGKNAISFYSFIDTSLINPDLQKARALRKKLGIKENDKVYVLAGTMNSRKGIDYLPAIAESFNDPNTHLIWLGNKPKSGLIYYIEQKCKAIKTTKVHLPGLQRDDYFNYLSLADIFLLTSREDPFPLVMIEAAFLGKPIVAFNSGGIEEFMQPGMGIVTKSMSTKELKEGIVSINEGMTGTNSDISKQRALKFDISNQLPVWEEILDSFIKRSL